MGRENVKAKQNFNCLVILKLRGGRGIFPPKGREKITALVNNLEAH